MPVTINGTNGVTFNDATTQSTAAVLVPAFDAIGAILWLNSSSATATKLNDAVSGSQLFYISVFGSAIGNPTSSSPVTMLLTNTDRRNASASFSAFLDGITGSACTFTNVSGTWRQISSYRSPSWYNDYQANTRFTGALYIRIS
jgi:hypothetical protein